jgi:hypothetical protein
MGVAVQFDYPTWLARYPEFTNVPESLASQYFVEAGFYLANDGSGPVHDPGLQTYLLNTLTAHIAEIYRLTVGPDGNSHAVSQLVGRVTNANQGSVSLQADFDQPQGMAQWFAQTKYGAAFWTASTGLRSAHYLPGQGSCGCYAPFYAGRPWLWPAY